MMVSTSFGPYSAVLLKLVYDIAPGTPVVWVDTGLNTDDTYRFVDSLCQVLPLNLHTYHPNRSVAHRNALSYSASTYNSENHGDFANELKLEPFRRALKDQAPDYWINGIRREDNDFRKTLGKVSYGPAGTIKIAPLYEWTESELVQFLQDNNLPDEKNYFDPTKGSAKVECGLHCRL